MENFTRDLERMGLGETLRQGRKDLAALSARADAPTLRTLRLAAGLSQSDLGKKVGVGQDRISLYENGRSKPDADTLDSMRKALGVDISILWKALGYDT